MHTTIRKKLDARIQDGIYVLVNVSRGPTSGWTEVAIEAGEFYVCGAGTYGSLEEALEARDRAREEHDNPYVEVFRLLPIREGRIGYRPYRIVAAPGQQCDACGEPVVRLTTETQRRRSASSRP